MKLIHTTSIYEPSEPDTQRRMAIASSTWEVVQREYPGLIISRHISSAEARRTSRDIGDRRALPFLKDMVEYGFAVVDCAADDALVLTNADTCLIPSRMPIVVQALRKCGMYYSSRLDHHPFTAPLPDEVALRGEMHPGADLVAFTRSWWDSARDDYPDMLFGAEAWDGVFKAKMRLCGFVEGPPVVYHEAHWPFWLGHLLTNPAQIHNRALARGWIRKHGVEDFLVHPSPDFMSGELVYAKPASNKALSSR